jgi:adenosylhomocysteine nucleosidase
MSKPIAIVAAMRRELAPLLGQASSRRRDGVELYDLPSALVAIGGIGRKAGLRAAEMAAQEANPEILISAGLAGALTPALKVGDILRAREVVDEATGEHWVTIGGEAVLVTALRVAGVQRKRSLASSYSASAVDMEGAAVASVAKQHGISFMAVKAISDEFDFPVPPMERFVTSEGQLRLAAFTAHIAVRPRWWIPVMRLGTNSRMASKNLCLALNHLIEEHAKASIGERQVRA